MPTRKPTVWIGSSRDDLRAFPDEVRRLVDDEDGNTYRAVYTVRFSGVIYVLHAFQKKSKRGIETSKRDIAIIKARLQTAEAHCRQNYGGTQ
jgi:phage-related protein